MMGTAGIYLGGVLLLLLGGLLFYARWQGRTSAQRDIAEKGVEHAKRANELDDEVARLGDADVDKRLFGDRK